MCVVWCLLFVIVCRCFLLGVWCMLALLLFVRFAMFDVRCVLLCDVIWHVFFCLFAVYSWSRVVFWLL